jgi:2-phospho-L-lactate/phosphoenolpyruvate guanylyltransferase
MSDYILIPCKSLNQGKSRLAGLLSEADRRHLCILLLSRTLILALSIQRSDHIFLVSPDIEVRNIGRNYGIHGLNDAALGLNEALREGRSKILNDIDRSASLLILPIDLVDATPEAIKRLIRPDVDVAIAPDEQRRGTNALYLGHQAVTTFRFAFGPDSFVAHRSWAEIQALRLHVIADPRLAFDLDGPEDYSRWQRRPTAVGHP